MIFDFLKAILLGICASAPLGPICALVIQKTLNHGRRAGIATGMGSALADTMFAALAVFAVAAVQDFIENNNRVLLICGGVIVMGLGIMMALKKRMDGGKRMNKVSAKFPAQAFVMALSNPGALALMFGLMLVFNVDGSEDKLITILGVSVGAVLWWTAFSTLVDRLGKKLKPDNLVIVNRIFGILVIAFGSWMTVKGLFSVFSTE